uniref:Uncharacterized protein n=1 Tax=Nelumbo nucifera TaxID=4432 RepID=A0A822ZW36_NELNU|nr:TPA_asm: hypothetical protein HUJ06_004368 [Nelumbo nucifera]
MKSYSIMYELTSNSKMRLPMSIGENNERKENLMT